jgi:hypothetical protein
VRSGRTGSVDEITSSLQRELTYEIVERGRGRLVGSQDSPQVLPRQPPFVNLYEKDSEKYIFPSGAPERLLPS